MTQPILSLLLWNRFHGPRRGLSHTDTHHDGESEEDDEIAVVVLPHAVTHERAVVVETKHASAADVAVLRPRHLQPGRMKAKARSARGFYRGVISDDDENQARRELLFPREPDVFISNQRPYFKTKSYTVHHDA